jgi:signal transduction histidine kinase
MLRKDGSTIHVESTTKRLDDGRILAIVHDVTERRRAEEAIRRLNQELEQRVRERTSELEDAIQVRDELLQVVSHDLRNPLAGIVGNVHFLHNQLASGNEPDLQRVKTLLARIRGATAKMQRLIDELLDFGRLQAGQPLTLQRKPVDLVPLAAQAADQHQHTSSLHKIKFEATVAELTGSWDSARLDRVIDNLLSNAIKYSPSGGEVLVKVSTGTRHGLDHAFLTVRDEGVGIASDEIPHIFEWFRRGPKHSGRISGAGIGLANSRQIVEQHGGTIDVISQEGAGSSFTVCLPLSQAQAHFRKDDKFQ